MNVSGGSHSPEVTNLEAAFQGIIAQLRAGGDWEAADRLGSEVAQIQLKYQGLKGQLALSRFLTEYHSRGQALLVTDERFHFSHKLVHA